MASSLEGSVAAVLSEVLNIPVDNTALAKRVVAAAGKGTIESFAVVCASFGEPSTTVSHPHLPSPAWPRTCTCTQQIHWHVILEQAHCDGTSIARWLCSGSHIGAPVAISFHHNLKIISIQLSMQCNQHMHCTTVWHGPYGIAFKTHHTHTHLTSTCIARRCGTGRMASPSRHITLTLT
jgi:hypothetical protein